MNERAAIIALARLCGVSGSEKEILEKFDELYNAAVLELDTHTKPAEVEVFKRPF